MLSPLQLNTSAYRPNRAARGSVPIRFGKSSNDEQFKKTLQAYNPVVGKLPDFKKPGKAPDFENSYKHLAPRAQDQFTSLTKEVSPEEIADMTEKKLLGIVEEAPDILWEAATNKALNDKLITEKNVDECRKDLIKGNTDADRKKKSFETLLGQITPKLPKDKAAEFAQSVSWDPKNPQTADDLLHLITTKFMLMRTRDPKYDIKKESKPLLQGEVKELNELLPKNSLRKAQVWLLGFAYSHFPGLPLSFLKSQLEGVVSSQFHQKVRYSILMENLFQKQYRRQEFDYYNPSGFSSNEDRKKIVKGIEVINEAAILKKYGLWTPTP